jgi:hypothetical protein
MANERSWHSIDGRHVFPMVLVLSACSKAKAKEPGRTTNSVFGVTIRRMPQVELLYDDECPNVALARANLHRAFSVMVA